jgi:hypothetical protein
VTDLIKNLLNKNPCKLALEAELQRLICVTHFKILLRLTLLAKPEKDYAQGNWATYFYNPKQNRPLGGFVLDLVKIYFTSSRSL